MHVRRRGLVAVLLLVTACVGSDRGPTSEKDEDEGEEALSSGSCGVERWGVKTGTDSAASQVNLTAQSTTIAALRAIPVPSGFGTSSPRFTYSGSPEIQNYKLTNVTLVEFKMETDSDYHLVLQDSSGNTMIAEIPYPGCMSGSPWLSAVTAARNAFDAKYAVTTSFQTVNATISITGVGFFDVLHGQTGVAPNGIELHSVQSICWGTNCSGGATPDFSIAASPTSVSGSGSSTISVGALNGFSSSVALTASGAPSGSTATLSPTSVTGSGTSTLTLSPGSAAAGTYTVAVKGTSGTLSHTANVSWTIAGSGGGGSLTNAGFESGLTGWTSSGTTSVSTTSHSGSQAAMVGSTNPGGDSSIAQTFTLPANATSVSFWYQVHCNDTITYDWATATLKDNTTGTTTTILPKTCTNGSTWVQASASATGGHSVTLTLSNHDDNNAGDPTYTLYDEGAIGTSGGGVTNPGFETGTLGSWTSTGVAAATQYPHTGTYAATLGNSSPSTDSTLAQTFTIPSGASTLTVWYRVICNDTITYDWATATLKDNTASTTTTVIPKTCTNTNTWVQASVNVSSMVGHSVTLTLTNHDDNNAGDATFTDFDDISVQ